MKESKYNNTVIEVLDDKHGERVVEFYRSLNINENSINHGGTCTKERNNGARYYGVDNGYFYNYSIDYVKSYNLRIIELPDDNINNDKIIDDYDEF